MLCLKKVYTDELLQIAILLSLLRVDRNSNLGYDYDVPAIGVGIDDIHGWDQSHSLIRREIQVHPKNLDSILLNYEQQLFDDLNSLGRYNRINSLQDVTAYLLNIDGSAVDETNNNATMNSVLFNRTDEETTSQNVPHTSSNNVNSVLVKDEPKESEECSLDSGFLNFNATENLHFKSEIEFNATACSDEGVSFKDESSQGDELTQEVG